MTYSVDSVVCDYGVYENVNGNRRLCVICNSRTNALLVADILNKDYEHQIADMRGKSRIKLIIDIPEDMYISAKSGYLCGSEIIVNAIKYGTPLDNNSERAEVQAYFDGEAYGWEQGRKALIADVKAEITEPHGIHLGKLNSRSNVGILMFASDAYERGIKHVIEILDNIGKAESEVSE